MDFSRQVTGACRLIDRWLAYNVAMERIPGLSVGIVYQQQVVFQRGYGYADLAGETKASATTCYRIASFSKVFTTIAILQLVEQGLLQLDERAQHYLPWLQSTHDDRVAQITIRQLLTHTSGLKRDGETTHWVDFRFPALEEIQQQVAASPMAYTPAITWKYSNFGYTLLGEIIRVVSGQAYETYVQEHIVQPIGLLHTGPTLNEKMNAEMAVGYGRDLPGQARQPFPAIETHVMASATGFTSNIADLCRFLLAQFEGDTSLLQETTKREMRRVQWLRDGYTSDWCLGLQTWKVSERRLYGHGGSFQGYQSRFGFDPEQNIGMVILTNAIDGPALSLLDGAIQVINHLIAHFDTFGQSENQVENAQRYEGRFRSIWGDTEMIEINGSLVMYASGPGSPALDFHQLRQQPDGNFIVSSGNSIGQLGERVRFEFDQQGTPVRAFIGANYADRVEG